MCDVDSAGSVGVRFAAHMYVDEVSLRERMRSQRLEDLRQIAGNARGQYTLAAVPLSIAAAVYRTVLMIVNRSVTFDDLSVLGEFAVAFWYLRYDDTVAVYYDALRRSSALPPVAAAPPTSDTPCRS